MKLFVRKEKPVTKRQFNAPIDFTMCINSRLRIKTVICLIPNKNIDFLKCQL